MLCIIYSIEILQTFFKESILFVPILHEEKKNWVLKKSKEFSEVTIKKWSCHTRDPGSLTTEHWAPVSDLYRRGGNRAGVGGELSKGPSCML